MCVSIGSIGVMVRVFDGHWWYRVGVNFDGWWISLFDCVW